MGKKARNKESSKILRGLEKRLAEGKISENTYLTLKEKYEDENVEADKMKIKRNMKKK